MDAMLPSRLGKLRIICSLPLFSDAICIKRQSAAEHGFTQILLSIALAQHMELPEVAQCELIELAIFAEIPKAYLGDPSFYLRQRHAEVAQMYREVRGRLYRETEEAMHLITTRDPELYGLHELIDAFAAKMFIEKECLLGNSYFFPERERTNYHKMRLRALNQQSLAAAHPATVPSEQIPSASPIKIDWPKAISFLDELFDEATRARLEGGLSEYSSTFIGMMEKLKEHYRYKGWSYHYPESVGEHTYQVAFLARILASKLSLNHVEKTDLYRLATLHDLAEAYASDVVYPVKIREKDLGKMHAQIEDTILKDLTKKLKFSLSDNTFLGIIVDICDRFSAQLYFDREQRSGNGHFKVPNTSMDQTRAKYSSTHPEVFAVLDELWSEFQNCFKVTSDIVL